MLFRSHGDTGAKGKMTEACHARMVGCSRKPGVPHDGGKAKEGLRATNNSDTEQRTVQLIHRKHSSTGVVSVVYLRSMRFGRNEFVVEVVVHGSSREVVDHVFVEVQGQ